MEFPSNQKNLSLQDLDNPSPMTHNADPVKNLPDYVSQKALSLSDRILDKAGKIKGENGEEALHDMRVATRRLRETLRLFAYYYPLARVKTALGKIKKITALLGLPRELDVNFLLLQQMAPPENAAPQHKMIHEYLLEILDTERNRLRRKMHKRFAGLDLPSLGKEVRTLIKNGTRRKKTNLKNLKLAVSALSSDSFLQTQLDDRVCPFRELSSETVAGMEDSALHQLRIQIKKLRYALELINPLFGNSYDCLISKAQALQNMLGEYHDLDVLTSFLQDHGQSLKSRNRLHLEEAIAVVLPEIQKRKTSLGQEIPRLYTLFIEALHDTIPIPNPAEPLPDDQSKPSSTMEGGAMLPE
jgi:CHAD domain-containing protein